MKHFVIAILCVINIPGIIKPSTPTEPAPSSVVQAGTCMVIDTRGQIVLVKC